jgi:MFS transporter, DHA1 family, multidrug resistance protein
MENPPAAAKQPTLTFLLLAAAMSAIPAVTTDIYLPALPELSRALNGTMAEGKATLAAYVLGLGFGQLFYGPWSDRVGRRPVILTGVTVYVVASLGCAIVGTMQEMVVLRFLQALGASSGIVISAAMVRDQFDHHESARIFSILLTLRGLGPIIAPNIGGVIVSFVSWRAIFWVTAAFGIALGSAILLYFHETRPKAMAVRARAESLRQSYSAVLRQPKILSYMITASLNFTCMFAWIAAAPYLIISVYKVPTLYFGGIFGINAAGFIAASFLNRGLLRTYHPDLILCFGAFGTALTAAVLLTNALTGFWGAAGILTPLFFVVGSLGIVSTNAIAGGLAVDPARAGTISALFGVGQFSFASLVTVGGAALARQPALSMAIEIAICAIGALAFPLWVLVKGAHHD